MGQGTGGHHRGKQTCKPLFSESYSKIFVGSNVDAKLQALIPRLVIEFWAEQVDNTVHKLLSNAVMAVGGTH